MPATDVTADKTALGIGMVLTVIVVEKEFDKQLFFKALTLYAPAAVILNSAPDEIFVGVNVSIAFA